MSERIAVIGAGPMGLAVAYQLIQEGHVPVLYEADDRVGGMTASFDFNGLQIERYYHFHCISDHAFLNLIEELGIADKMNWTETKMGYWYQNRLQPWGNPIALLKFKGLGFIAKLRYGLHAFYSTKINNWKKLDSVRATDWIRRWVGKEAYEVLWHRLFYYKFYELSDNLSAAWIWSRIRRIGRSRYNLFREKLGYLEGGSNTLLSALEHYIRSHGGEINLSSAVSRVCVEDTKVVAVDVNGEKLNYSKVISTMPLPYVSRVIPDLSEAELNFIKSVKNVAVVCVIAKLKKSVTENFWLNTNDPDMDIPGLVEYSRLNPLDKTIVYIPFYMPASNEKFKDSDAVFENKVKSYLMTINKDITEDDFIDIRVSRYRFAQPVCEPDFAQRLPSAKTSIEGLWLADTSYYYPEDRGISESIEFGRAMARQVVEG